MLKFPSYPQKVAFIKSKLVITLFITIFPFMAGAIPVNAFFYPYTISDQTQITGVGEYTFYEATAENPITIQAIRIQQSGSQSETMIMCGQKTIAHNYGVRDYSLDLLNYLCQGTFKAEKTGTGDSAFISVSYLPFNIVSSSFLTDKLSSTSLDITSTLTAGDLAIILALIVLIFLNLFNLIKRFV